MKIRDILKKWKLRKKYEFYDDMPTRLIIFFGLSSFLVAGYYGFVLGQVTPEYINAANGMPLTSWGIYGWSLTLILAALLFITWYMGNISWRCNSILRERYFK